MSVMVIALVSTINSFFKEDASEKDKRDISWVAISVFLHDLLMASKHKDIAIGILEALIQELKDANTQQTSVA